MKIETLVHIATVMLAVTLMATYDGPDDADIGANRPEKNAFSAERDCETMDGSVFQFASASVRESANGANPYVVGAESSSGPVH